MIQAHSSNIVSSSLSLLVCLALCIGILIRFQALALLLSLLGLQLALISGTSFLSSLVTSRDHDCYRWSGSPLYALPQLCHVVWREFLKFELQGPTS